MSGITLPYYGYQGVYNPSSGPGSFYITGENSRILVPSNAAYAFGTGNYTIEFWFRSISYPSLNNFLFSWGQNFPNYGPAAILLRDGSNQNAYASLYESNNVSIITTLVAGTWTYLQPNTWYHYAATRTSDTIYRLFINGSAQTGTVSTSSRNYGQNGITLGNSSDLGAPINGYMTNFRVSNIVRYTNNFTPSTVPLTSDANTLLLLNANGDNWLADASSFNRTGITGPGCSWSSLSPFP